MTTPKGGGFLSLIKLDIMHNYWIFLLLLLGTTGFAQDALPTFQESSDPKAKAILSQVKDTYESYQSLQANFTLLIELAEMDTERQSGTMKMKGEQYHLSMNGQEIISDGQTLWFYLPNSNEVQINTVEEDADDGEILSPTALLKIYDRDDYIYHLVNEGVENGKNIQQVEFKPVDRDSEYSKLRATFDKKTHQLIRIKAFAKDGSRYTLLIDKLVPNPTFAAQEFSFNAKDYPGVYVEDLRID